MGRLDGKVVVVTGGGLGIGRATCRMAAREGARVVVTDVKEREGTEVADAIAGDGGDAVFLRHDVSREDDWIRIMEAVRGRHGQVDAVVNNAGLCTFATIEETSLALWRQLMAVNLDGVFLGTQQSIRAMKGRGGGSIVNLSSIEGLIGDPDLAAYNATKGGVTLLTKSAALHCARAGYGIRVNSVHPGAIRTPMVDGLLNSRPNRDEAEKALTALHPVGHMGEPDDIAAGIVYLASDESRFMTGAALVIDGGYTAQ